MKQMSVDPETGFLAQPSLTGFTIEKKKRLLELLENDPHCSGIEAACKIVDVATSTVWRHLERDAQFRSEWERLKRHFANRVEDVLAHCALDPKKTIDRIVYLKAYMPDKYNPQIRVEQQVNFTFDGPTFGNARDRQMVMDAQVIPPDNSPATVPENYGPQR